MKVFTLLISTLFISLNIFAQLPQLQPDSILVEDWSINDSYWENDQISFYTYSDGKISLITVKSYDTNSGSWINDFKQDYTYAAAGILDYITSSFWDITLNEWEVSSKVDYIFDTSGNALTFTTTYYEDGEWHPAYFVQNTYNTDNLKIESISQTWNADDESYFNSLKTVYSYDSNGNQTNALHQNFPDSEWINFSQTTTQYTSFNSPEILIRTNWNLDDQEWINYSKRTYTYGADEFVAYSLFEKYNIATEAWELDSQENYTINSEGTVYQVVEEEYLLGSATWQNETRMTSYVHLVTALSDINPLTVAVFPNPSSSNVNIQLGENAIRSTYTITNVSGKVMANDSFYGQNAQINTEHLAAGIYILEVETNGKMGAVKIVRK